MKTAKPFSYSVNSAGLPRDYCPLPPSLKENIIGLTAQELAKTYWLLASVNVKFAYYTNKIRIERSLTLTNRVKPIKRILKEPVFFYGKTQEDSTESLIELNLYSIAFDIKDETRYNIEFKVYERDPYSIFFLSSHDLKNKRLLDKLTFNFMDRELTVKLWTIAKKATGKIEFFQASPEYYLITDQIV